MRYYGSGITSAQPLVFLIFILTSFGRVNTWYIGCVEDQPILEVPQGLVSGSEEAQWSPGECCSSCLQAGFLYAAIQGEFTCKCSNSSSLPILNEEYCNNICDTGSNLLPCGGDGTLSVYSVKGPYLLSLRLDKTQSLIQQETSVLFEAKTYLAQEPQEDDALPNLTGDVSSLDEVDFVWFVGQSEWSAVTRPSSNETIQASLVHTFLEEGEWTIGVQVRNPVSLLRAFTNVTVVQPVPSDLQVILHPSQDDIPSCIPIQDGLPSASSATAAVFVREEVVLQASLTMGINLTFHWSFSDDGSSDARAPYMQQPSCEGIACLRDSQVHTFTREGVFNVAVNVSNQLGSVQKTLQVVVMNRDISALNMSLGEQTSFIHKLNSNVNFLITMETAARSELFLEIDFGDGSVYNHSLKDVNDTFILGGDQNVAHLHLTASYGEGCELVVSLDHVYQSEGVFHPNVSVYSTLSSNVTARARLPQGVIIQRTLTGVEIDCHEVYSTNQSAILKVTMPAVTQNISCAWVIYYQNVTQRTSTNCVFLYTFSQSGKYVFKVSVHNLVNQVVVERTVEVQDQVTGLRIESRGDRMVQTGSEVSVLAYVTGGTDVNFRWNFHDNANGLTQVSEFESNLYVAAFVANHTYITTGHFNVSVTAHNLISSKQVYLPNGYVVQDSITEIILPSMVSTLLPDTTVIQASIHRGSHIDFHMDYGEGLVSPFVVQIPGGIYLLHHVIPLAGSYAVTVVASNGVSSRNATTCVDVQEDIGSLSVFIYSPQEEHAVIVAHINGVIPKRTDLKYTWHVGGSVHVSASPLLELGNVTSDTLQVLLLVTNQVTTQEIQVDLLKPSHDVQLIHPFYAEVGHMVAFSTQLQSEQPRNLTIDYGDSSSPVFSTSTSSTFNWAHSYLTTGVYIVTLRLESDVEETVVVSALSIQERLTSFTLDGPSISKFSRPVAHQIWEVIPQSGSDILYSWSVTKVTSTDGSSGHDVITSMDKAAYQTKLPLSFHSYGDYNITVIASNAWSRSSVTIVTTLQEAIVNVIVNFPPMLIGTPFGELEIIVDSGNSLKFDIDFGDGSMLHITQLEASLSRSEIILTRLTPTLSKYSIRKTYTALGEYHCTVRVYNFVSEVSATVVTQVEERISGLQLTSESSAVMRTGEEVVMIATIDSGNDVIFEWFFDGQGTPEVENFHNKSTATYRFYDPGNFIVRVSVSNHLQQAPLVAFHSEPFIVQTPLIPATLDIQVNGQLTGAPLQVLPSGTATFPVEFLASCLGSHVVFEFDYGDGTTEVIPSHSENEFSNGYSNHVYTQEGIYIISVHAYNNYGNASKTLSNPFYVQIAPVFRHWCPILPCNNIGHVAYKIGQYSNFTVQLERGSHVYYNWSMGDQTDYLMHGKSVSHKYLSAGRFYVSVVGYNQVGSTEVYGPQRVLVHVQEQVQSVEIQVAQLLNQLGTRIEFQAIGGDGATEFVWDMGDGKTRTRNSPDHDYTYHLSGTYAVTVMAKNFVSNATSEPVELLIQEPIDRISVILEGTSEAISRSCCSALVGQLIEMSIGHYGGSHMFLEWDFGDGSDEVSGTDLVVHHAYNRTGEFTVSVFASNALNNGTASKNVFILKDELCYPPPLSIVGGEQRKANFSDNIRVEISVSLVCESSDVITYLWTLKDSNGSDVSSSPSWASLDQRTAFIRHNKLPYGSYTLYLKGTMNGTIVYSEDSISLVITPTPLVAHIEGGTTRVVGNNTMVTLDGGKSYDLDYPEDPNFKYNWTCYQLVTPTRSCFLSTGERIALNTTSNRLVFHTDLLLLNETSDFVFVLEVGKEGRQSVQTSQVLYIRDQNPVNIMVECTSCVNGIVNRNDLLSLNAVCSDCSVNATYTWTLYRIRDGAEARDYNYHCELTGNPNLIPELPLQPVTTRTPVITNVTNKIDEGVNTGEDSFYNEIGTAPLDSINEAPDDDQQYNSFFEDVPELSFNEDLPPQVSIGEDIPLPDNGPGPFGEASIFEEVPGGTGELPGGTGEVPGEVPPSVEEDTSDNNDNMTYVEEVEATTIVYEYAETTPQDEVVEENSYVEFVPSFVEGIYEPSFDEALPHQDSFVEDTQQDGSILEDHDVEDGNQTSSANDTSHDGGISKEESNSKPTSQPKEETTDATQDALPPVTGTASYIEYVYEYYYEEDIGDGAPTASYNTGGGVPSQNEQGSIPEYVPVGTSQAQPSNAYGEPSIQEAGPNPGPGIPSIAEGVGGGEPSYTEGIGGDYEEYDDYYKEDLGSDNVPPLPGSGGGGDNDNSEQPGDEVGNGGDPEDPEVHIVDLQKEMKLVTVYDTTTGVRGNSLTFRRDFVDEGLTYAVEVVVDSHEGRREGKASQYLFVNVGPHHGFCLVRPNEGNELDRIFQANCNEWVDDDITPMRMELSYRLNESDPKTVLYYGINQEINFQLPAGFEENDRRVWVDIVMEDSRGSRAPVCSVVLRVTPKVFAEGENKEEFLYNSTVPMDSKLVEYVHNGDHNKVLIQVLTIGDTMNHLPRLTTEDLTYTLTQADREWTMDDDHHDDDEQIGQQKLLDVRRDVRKALLGGCRYLPMRDAVELEQRSFAMARSTAIPEELSNEAIMVAAEVLDTCTETALMCSHEDGMEISDEILSYVISTASSTVDALALNHTHHMRDTDREMVITRTTSALSNLLKTKLSSQEKDKLPICMETNSLKVLGAKVSSLSNQKFVNPYTTVILPKNLDEKLLEQHQDLMLDSEEQCHGIEIISFLQNPYSWGQGGERITSAATSVELFSCDNDKLDVTELQEEDGVVMEFHHTCHHGHDRHCNFTFSTEFMSVHQFNVTDQNIRQTFHISLELINVGRTLPVGVLLRYGQEPTPYRYDVKWVYTMSDNKLDIFLKPDEFNVTGVYYIALLDDTFDQEVYRGDVVKERPYRLRMWWGDCLYWKTGADKDKWLSDGCTALKTSTFEKTVCQCNHLSTFAVSFHPIVTTAKFIDLAMFLRPNTNAIPYSFVSALIGVYAFLFIYCYFADKHDEKKQGLIYLKDNQASDQQYYEITVETGFRTGAGTTARVSIVLHGDDGHSETKELICDDGRPLFERNSRDRFIVSVPESIGNIYKVLVWHNNGGISPSWYLSRIAVRDLITGHKWYFICERWFAVEEDDGKIERGIDVLKEGVGFSKAFWAKGAQYFADYYIWSSIFTRPPYSVFTRVQRLTCCLSISMGFLSICALRYYIMSDEDIELGLVDVSGEAVLCGIIVALLAIPINFPVIMLFRRAKPNNEPDKPEIFSGRRASDIYGDTNSSPEFIQEKIMRDGSWDSGMMDQTAINTLHNLQAWARQKWKHRRKSSIFPPNRVAPIEMAVAASESTEQDISDQQSVFDFGSVSSFDISDSGLSSSYNHSLNGFHHVCIPRHKKVTNPKVWLPHSFLYIAWGICFGIILFSAVITSVIGYGFNRTKAIYWTQSVYFSFLQCIFVTQPAVMSMFTIVKSWRHRKNIKIFDHYDDNIDLVNRKSLHRSRLDLYENDLEKGIAARQRSRYLRFARPPQAKELQKAKERMLKEKNMYTILKDAILYSIVFLCLLWVAYGKDLKDHHPVNTAVINTFVKTPHPFTKINTVEHLWHWLENDMVDTLYWDTWYNGQKVMEDQGTLMNGANVLIGKASLRQLRVKPDTCHIAPEVRHLFEDCHAGFSAQSQSKQAYGPDYVWYYQGKNELHRANKWGMFGSYEGDGYAINLNNSRVDAARQIEQLKTNSWIDSQTRLVTLEFTLYNAPTNLFVSVALMSEIPGTGAVYPFPKVESVLLYRYETAYDYFIICCEMVFLLLVAVTAMSEVHKAIRMRTKYFYSMWSWLEMGTIIVALTYFAMYVTRFIFVEEVIHRFHSTYLEEFVDVSSVAYWDQCIRDLIGCLLFLIGVKVLHLFRFNRTVAKFSAVLGAAIKEILLFALYYILVEGAFACLGVLLLGSHHYPMKHAFTALEALTSSTVGHTPHDDDMEKHYPVWWPMYYVAHIICVFLLLSALIKAVICHSYKKMKNFEREEVSAGELFQFFWDHFMAFIGILKYSKKDSNNMGKNTLPTEFTMAEIEYQVDELLFKMNAMSHEHSMPEKCHGYLDDSDGTHGHGEDTVSCSSSEVHSYNQARLDERVQKIETNLYSANPELRELLDGFCLIDEDREKELRSQLEMEIFRQLQLQRQEEAGQRPVESTGDSGRDTQSVSDRLANEEVLRPRPLPSIRGDDGRIAFPKPVPNLGSLDMQVSRLDSPNRFPNTKPAWSLEEPRKSSSTPENMSQDNLTNDEFKDKHVQNYGSALFVRRSSPHLSNTDGSAGEQTNGRRLTNHPRLKRRPPSARSRDRPPSSQLVSDYPEGTCHDKTISVDSFPLPNTLESFSSSSEEERKPPPRHKRKESGNARRRLRKTRSQGKGKGRGRYGDDAEKAEDPVAYMNAGYSSDSDESIPIIPMGPLKYTR